jgi:pimeloyl-ACP methyl ester carboxylesterase
LDAEEAATMKPDGRYLEVDGRRHWVVEAGAGRPLLLLHGGLDDSEAFFEAIGDRLAGARRVIGFDRAGHGRTADREGPFHYTDMVAETVGMIATLGLGPVDLCGWSDGGIVALLLALARPELVRRQVLIGANFHHDIMDPATLDPAAPWLESARQRFGATSPAGIGHFPEIVRKSVALWLSEPELSAADLARVKAPTLVLNGDRDTLIPLAHTVQLFEAIPGAELAIVPGSGHFVPTEKPDVTVGLIAAFLDAELPG